MRRSSAIVSTFTGFAGMHDDRQRLPRGRLRHRDRHAAQRHGRQDADRRDAKESVVGPH